MSNGSGLRRPARAEAGTIKDAGAPAADRRPSLPLDATIVAAPKQRNTDAEKADIKAGKVPDAWKEKPARLRQKDRDARWTVKFSKATVAEDGKPQQRDIAIPAFGYKNHMWTAPVSQESCNVFDRIACDHMSGLWARSHMTAGQDGFRDASSQHASGL